MTPDAEDGELKHSGWRRSAGGKSRSVTTTLKTSLALSLEVEENGSRSTTRKQRQRSSVGGHRKTKEKADGG